MRHLGQLFFSTALKPDVHLIKQKEQMSDLSRCPARSVICSGFPGKMKVNFPIFFMLMAYEHPDEQSHPHPDPHSAAWAGVSLMATTSIANVSALPAIG